MIGHMGRDEVGGSRPGKKDLFISDRLHARVWAKETQTAT